MTRKYAGTCLLVFVVLLSMSLCCAAGDFKFHRVAQSGMPAPVPSQISIISSFSFNDHGEAAFIADNGLLIKSGNTARIIAGFGQAAPGGGHFIAAATPSLNNSGDRATSFDWRVMAILLPVAVKSRSSAVLPGLAR